MIIATVSQTVSIEMRMDVKDVVWHPDTHAQSRQVLSTGGSGIVCSWQSENWFQVREVFTHMNLN